VMSDRISKAKIPDALDALRALGAKELDDVSARDAIRKMRRQIERVLRLGYTYEEVSTTLAGLDINISGERIKYLLNDIRKKTRKKSKPSKEDEIESETDINETDTLQSSEISESSESSEINKSSEVREISAASTSPTATENNQKSSPVSPDKKPLTTNSKNNKNNTRDNNTNSFAFQPQLIDDEDL
jgi:hypothetical protein